MALDLRLIRKQAAVESEDYDAAKALKEAIARLRTTADLRPGNNPHTHAHPQQQHPNQHLQPQQQQQQQASPQLLQPQAAANGKSDSAGAQARQQAEEGQENPGLTNQGWGASTSSPVASVKRASPRSHSLDTDSLASPLGTPNALLSVGDVPLRLARDMHASLCNVHKRCSSCTSPVQKEDPLMCLYVTRLREMMTPSMGCSSG